MDRRTLLRGTAGLLSGAGLAGCTGAGGEVPVTARSPPPGVGGDGADSEDGPRTTAQTVVSIEGFDAVEGENGTLVLVVTVSNESVRRQERLVRATVTLDGDQTVAERFVTLDPGASETVRLDVDVDYREWLDGGSFVPEVVNRTPATPRPTDAPTPTGTADTATPTRTPDADTRTGTATGTPGDAGTDPG